MSGDGEVKSVAAFAAQVKGLDSSGVEVDEEQVAPTIAAGSAEEAAALAEMETLIPAGVEADKETKLMCLRGRKYDTERAAALLPKLLELKKEYGIGEPSGEQLKTDLRSCKICATGAKDEGGRAIIWLRLRFHDPKTSKAEDMTRLLSTVMLSVLKDPDVQRFGVVIINDVTGVKLKNLDPAAVKKIMADVLPRLPVRVGRICIFNPPWFLGHVVIPIVLALISKKLRGRIALINGFSPDKLTPYVSKAHLPAELEGTYDFDQAKWAESMVAALP